MLAIASQIVLCLVLAALLGLIIGYLLGKGNCPKATYKEGPIRDPHTEDDGDCQETEVAPDAPTREEAAIDASAEPQSLMNTSAPSAQASHSPQDESAKDDSSTRRQNAKADNEPASAAAASAEQTAAGNASETAAPSGDSTDNAQKQTPTPDASPKEADVGEAKAPSKPSKATNSSPSDADKPTGASEKKPVAKKGKKGPKKTETKSPEKGQEAPAPTDADKPATLLDTPRDGQKDDLKRIKGIGVKIETLLNETGVYHFDQIAAWSEKEAAWIDHKVSFPGRALRDDWIGQAKLLAEGKETEFSKRVDKGEVASSKAS